VLDHGGRNGAPSFLAIPGEASVNVLLADVSVDAGAEPPSVVGSRISAVGVAYPAQRLTTKQLLDSRRHRFPLDLEKHTGIHERRVCREGEDSLTLAIDAARDALRHSPYTASDIEMLIVSGITRFVGGLDWQLEPALSLSVKDAIGAAQALNFDVSNACAGMLTGVHILDNFIARGAVSRGMVISGEYITNLSYNAARTMRTAASKQAASLTLGDAGAAVILDRAPDRSHGIASSVLSTIAEHSDLCIGRPATDAPGGTMTTQVGDLHRAAISHSPWTMLEAIEKSGFPLESITHVIPHQTSASAIKAAIKHGWRKIGRHYPAQVVINLEEFGNTASTTHFTALRRCLDEHRLKPGDRILMVCSASGLTVGAMVFSIDQDLWERYGRGD
jgi:3-oxoacyl-[acyl-carrier-protein] synthase III